MYEIARVAKEKVFCGFSLSDAAGAKQNISVSKIMSIFVFGLILVLIEV